MAKNLPAMQESWVRSLGREDALEQEMATYQYSCLENSMDRGAWQVTVPFSRGSSQPRDQTQVSRIAGGFFTS